VFFGIGGFVVLLRSLSQKNATKELQGKCGFGLFKMTKNCQESLTKHPNIAFFLRKHDSYDYSKQFVSITMVSVRRNEICSDIKLVLR